MIPVPVKMIPFIAFLGYCISSGENGDTSHFKETTSRFRLSKEDLLFFFGEKHPSEASFIKITVNNRRKRAPSPPSPGNDGPLGINYFKNTILTDGIASHNKLEKHMPDSATVSEIEQMNDISSTVKEAEMDEVRSSDTRFENMNIEENLLFRSNTKGKHPVKRRSVKQATEERSSENFLKAISISDGNFQNTGEEELIEMNESNMGDLLKEYLKRPSFETKAMKVDSAVLNFEETNHSSNSYTRGKTLDTFSDTEPVELSITVTDSTGSMNFDLRSNTNLFSPNFKVVVHSSLPEEAESHGDHKLFTSSKLEELHEYGKNQSQSCVFVGRSEQNPQVQVALTNCDGMGFTGLIMDGKTTHLVRPAVTSGSSRRRRRSLDDDLHIMHATTGSLPCGINSVAAMRALTPFDVVMTDELRTSRAIMNLSDSPAEERAMRYKRMLDASQYQIETAVFVDDAMYDFVKSVQIDHTTDVIKRLTDIVFAIMNGVDILYHAPSLYTHFDITLVRLDILKSSTDGPAKGGGEIKRYLSSFCVWQHKLSVRLQGQDSTFEPWDHALMLTGLDLYASVPSDSSVIGLAWVAGMCSANYSCTINEGTSFEAVYVIAHEMAHNLDANHDGDGNDCDANKYIMSSKTGPGKVMWSDCSNLEMSGFINSHWEVRQCLTRGTSKRTSKEIDYHVSGKKPGQIFTVEDQCTFALGADFTPYRRDKSPYEDICREIWCRNSTHAVRAHPALEGTTCSSHKVCIAGQCLEETQTNAIGGPAATTTTTATTRSSTTTTRTPDRRQPRRSLLDLLETLRNYFSRHRYLHSDDLPAHRLTPLSGNNHQDLITKLEKLGEVGSPVLNYTVVTHHDWVLGNTSICNATCGGGYLTVDVSCAVSVGVLTPSGKLLDLNTTIHIEPAVTEDKDVSERNVETVSNEYQAKNSRNLQGSANNRIKRSFKDYTNFIENVMDAAQKHLNRKIQNTNVSERLYDESEYNDQIQAYMHEYMGKELQDVNMEALREKRSFDNEDVEVVNISSHLHGGYFDSGTHANSGSNLVIDPDAIVIDSLNPGHEGRNSETERGPLAKKNSSDSHFAVFDANQNFMTLGNASSSSDGTTKINSPGGGGVVEAEAESSLCARDTMPPSVRACNFFVCQDI